MQIFEIIYDHHAHVVMCTYVVGTQPHIATIGILKLGLGEIINQISNYSHMMIFIWIGCLFYTMDGQSGDAAAEDDKGLSQWTMMQKAYVAAVED